MMAPNRPARGLDAGAHAHAHAPAPDSLRLQHAPIDAPARPIPPAAPDSGEAPVLLDPEMQRVFEALAEILPLAERFLAVAGAPAGRTAPAPGDDARAALLAHAWPDKVRELRNVVDRAFVMSRGGSIAPQGLALPAPRTAPDLEDGADETEDTLDIRKQLHAFERTRIEKALAETGGNQTKAARLLGVSRRTLTNKLNAHALPRPRKHRPPPPSGRRLAGAGGT